MLLLLLLTAAACSVDGSVLKLRNALEAVDELEAGVVASESQLLRREQAALSQGESVELGEADGPADWMAAARADAIRQADNPSAQDRTLQEAERRNYYAQLATAKRELADLLSGKVEKKSRQSGDKMRNTASTQLTKAFRSQSSHLKHQRAQAKRELADAQWQLRRLRQRREQEIQAAASLQDGITTVLTQQRAVVKATESTEKEAEGEMGDTHFHTRREATSVVRAAEDMESQERDALQAASSTLPLISSVMGSLRMSGGDDLGESAGLSTADLKRRLRQLREQIRQAREDNRQQESQIEAASTEAMKQHLEAQQKQGLSLWEKEEKAVDVDEDAAASARQEVQGMQVEQQSVGDKMKKVNQLLEQSISHEVEAETEGKRVVRS